MFMKTVLICLSLALLTSGAFCPAVGQSRPGLNTLSFAVSGSCEMCKETIEESLDVKGVKKAIWDRQTGRLTVVYDSTRIGENELHRQVAASGYDTEKIRAEDKVYATLPDCCRYTRRTYPPKP
jgi:copper chaperone CopZ